METSHLSMDIKKSWKRVPCPTLNRVSSQEVCFTSVPLQNMASHPEIFVGTLPLIGHWQIMCREAIQHPHLHFLIGGYTSGSERSWQHRQNSPLISSTQFCLPIFNPRVDPGTTPFSRQDAKSSTSVSSGTLYFFVPSV
jgi:hypothetical protein